MKNLVNEFAGVQEPTTAKVRYALVRKLKDRHGIEFGRIYSQPNKDLFDILPTALELVAETLLSLFLRVRVKRTFDMNEVIAAHMNTDDIELPVMAPFGRRPTRTELRTKYPLY
ncbi:hypothetical protein [Bradyrhizobium sp. USDA 4473]